jgi:hypothetical protein
MAPLPPVAYRRAAARTSAAGTPVISSMASGELRLGDEVAPLIEGLHIAALAHELFLDQPFGDHHVRQAVDQRDVGAGRSFK